MPNPILVELTRGGTVESVHTGALAVCDSSGAIRSSIGDIDRPIFPRSSIKAFQALPVLATGTADRYGYGKKEIAFLCASHSGTDDHAALAADMLARAGQSKDALACGAHDPMHTLSAKQLFKRGEQPSRLHNNCSGKHSGMVATCVQCGDDVSGYCDIHHPHQRRIARTLHDFTGFDVTRGPVGIDGCSAPNWAIPLRNLAHAFARLMTGDGLDTETARHARAITDACMAEPFYVAGPDRLDTVAMTKFPGRVFMKTGAEAVYCGAFPESGLGFALKIDDGNGRASEAVMTALMQSHLRITETFDRLGTFRNYAGIEVGEIRLTDAAKSAL
ncbi:MAG TPA: asparaginase [Hyphomicrobiaceae bacterium]|nr:asparaginase [Hyphomicrobiaceae bacterium]